MTFGSQQKNQVVFIISCKIDCSIIILEEDCVIKSQTGGWEVWLKAICLLCHTTFLSFARFGPDQVSGHLCMLSMKP